MLVYTITIIIHYYINIIYTIITLLLFLCFLFYIVS